jgi:hypothetical protein
MNLEEKINRRVEQLLAELEQVRDEYNKVNTEEYFEETMKSNMDYSFQLDELEWKLECASRCIQELKQLLNN